MGTRELGLRAQTVAWSMEQFKDKNYDCMSKLCSQVHQPETCVSLKGQEA